MRDLPLLLGLVAAGLAAGAALGLPGGAAAGLGAFVCIQYVRLRALRRWLDDPSRPPQWLARGGPLADIGERVRQLQAGYAREAEERERTIERLRESFSALKDGIVILDGDLVIEWCNPGARRLLGLRFPEDVGQVIVNLLRYPGFAEYLGSRDHEHEFEFAVPGSRALVLQVQATGFGRESTVLFVRDVSALKRLETMRQDFVANISHELRTPLTVIAGYVDTLSDLLPGDSPVIERVLAQMRQQSARMENLLKDLLLLARLESGEDGEPADEEAVSVCAMLESIRENALASCAGERHIALDCDPRLRLRANRLELESIFSNIVFNAVKYTAPGGHITVSFRRGEADLRFSVSDDGIGIDPSHIPRLTERFYRVDKSRSIERGGTGLGLAIVKHALKRLDGELEVRSRPGAGSTFECILPLGRLVSPAAAA